MDDLLRIANHGHASLPLDVLAALTLLSLAPFVLVLSTSFVRIVVVLSLVRSAIGFDQKRGDQVEVVNLRFAEAPAVAPVAEPTGLLGMLQFTKDDVMYIIELGVMMLLGLVVMFMVIRPLVKRILSSEEIAAALGGESPALTDGQAQAAGAAGQALLPGTNATAQLIDVAQVQGQVHAQSVHRVGELAERNPNETVSIVRQWLSEPEPA